MESIKKSLDNIKEKIEETAELISKKLLKTNEIISRSYSFDANELEGKKEQLNCKGIYIFEFKLKPQVFKKDEFNKVRYASKLLKSVEPNNISRGSILYVGKSENLFDRLSEHINSLHATTYSLKLDNEERQAIKKNLRVRCYIFGDSMDEFYKIISRELEQTIADKYKDKLLIANK